MRGFLTKFAKDEYGAVTVDWVILTAAIVSLAFLVWPLFNENVTGLSTATDTAIGVYNANLDYDL
ncbi:hypothetical protein [Marivita sp. S2033]|uniref:hypothetical protein n=1 Tax=Marivita sp. S2033 TaxID=3373187 RepID=UPI003982B278